MDSPAAQEALATQEALLVDLPPRSRVAVVTMVGSLCPITLGHVQCYVEARKLLLDQEPSVPRPQALETFSECLGLVILNGDRYVGQKVRAKGQKALDMGERAELVHLATTELPWLCYGSGDRRTGGTRLRDLQHKFPGLRFEQFSLNGADDVRKYRKWNEAGPRRRMITMGRPGSTEAVRNGMASARVAPEHCLLGPELPDISSSSARERSRAGDAKGLLEMLHPAVADWLLRSDGHAALADTAAPQPASSLSTSEKDVLRLAKKLREIAKIDARAARGEMLEANQHSKLAAREAIRAELEQAVFMLPAGSDMRRNIEDVAVPPDVVAGAAAAELQGVPAKPARG